MNRARRIALQILENCDCDKEVIQDHHLKLADKPSEAHDINLEHKGEKFEGWYAPKDDEIHVVVFCTSMDVDMYKENTCPKDEEEVKSCIKQLIDDILSHR